MWQHVTNHLIISNDKDSNSENRIKLRVRDTIMWLQQTTRQLWASQDPFEPYTVYGSPQQNVPEDYIKGAVWKTDILPN
jgi:hypothetical protein